MYLSNNENRKRPPFLECLLLAELSPVQNHSFQLSAYFMSNTMLETRNELKYYDADDMIYMYKPLKIQQKALRTKKITSMKL